MADLLSAASLLLTVLTILYSLWYGEISNASSSDVERYAANRNIAYRDARTVFLFKALPLCLASAALFYRDSTIRSRDYAASRSLELVILRCSFDHFCRCAVCAVVSYCTHLFTTRQN